MTARSACRLVGAAALWTLGLLAAAPAQTASDGIPLSPEAAPVASTPAPGDEAPSEAIPDAPTAAPGDGPGPASAGPPESVRGFPPARAADRFVVMVEEGVATAALARAWAVLGPEIARSSEASRIIQLRVAPGFEPGAVVSLLEATKGVLRAEPEATFERTPARSDIPTARPTPVDGTRIEGPPGADAVEVEGDVTIEAPPETRSDPVPETRSDPVPETRPAREPSTD